MKRQKLVALVAVVATGVLAAQAGVVSAVVEDPSTGSVLVGKKGTSQELSAGSKIDLKATPAKGYVFAGWYLGKEPAALETDYRTASTSFVAREEDVVLSARFITPADDYLYFDFSVLSDLEPNEAVADDFLVDSASYPDIKFTGLPKGLSFDAKTLTFKGGPTQPGVYQVSASGKNLSGYQYSQLVTVRVGNTYGERIEGSDFEVAIGEPLDAEVADFFSYEEEELTALTVSGWPKGVSYDSKNRVVRGTPAQAGDYVVTATAKYATDVSGNRKATTEVATMLFTVTDLDPADYDVDLEGLGDLEVGFALPEDGVWIGGYDPTTKTGITKIGGLPSGLTAEKVVDVWDDIDKVSGVTNRISETYYVVTGVPNKAGASKITVTVAVSNEAGKLINKTLTRTVVVAAAESYYVDVRTDSPNGSVSGSAVVQPGTKVSPKATAAKGYVFSGWYDEDGNAIALESADYRNPAATFVAGLRDDTVRTWIAHFVTVEEDAASIVIDELPDQEYFFDGEDDWSDISFLVDSLSLATVKASGLPTGFSIVSLGDGEYGLSYDSKGGKNVPYPGHYACTVTATTASKSSVTATFTIIVGNWMSDAIDILDDLGEYVPGETIDPIDLTQAVDFEQGETLTVSGLPKGLTFNTKSDAKKGIEANTITGTPTVPGVYTVKFTTKPVVSVTTNKAGKITYAYGAVESATATLTVLPFPELAVAIDEAAMAAGCKVTGAGRYIQGSKVTLKAVAAPGYVFVGWSGVPAELAHLETLRPTLSYVTGVDDVEIVADFLPVSEDSLTISPSEDVVIGLKAKIDNPNCLFDLVESTSLPTVSVAGLPKGLKFDAATGLLSGEATQSGYYNVTISAKNAGGYTFVRVVRMIVLREDGGYPSEVTEPNAAQIDFGQLEDAEITTGVLYTKDEGTLRLDIPAQADTGASVTKIQVAGVPSGLAAETSIDEEGNGEVVFFGVANKPGLCKLTVDVTYGKAKAKSEKTLVVQDGGSVYLSVVSADVKKGTVTGTGVYAAGSTIKLSAKAASKCVFAGWYDGEIPSPQVCGDFGADDYRVSAVSFPCVIDEISSVELVGNFVASVDDQHVAIDFEGDAEEALVDVWELETLDEEQELLLFVESASLPKLSAKGLPKGMKLDASRAALVYDPAAKASIVPGVYTVTLSAENLSKAKTSRQIEVRVPNKTSDVIASDPDMEAYALTVGKPLGETFLGVGLLDDDYKLSVSGLPSGLSLSKGGEIVGVPTKAGVVTVTLTATKKGAATEVATITVAVAPLPSGLVGSFNGYAYYGDGESVCEPNGQLTVSTTEKGGISAKLVLPQKTVSFSAACWDEVEESYASVVLTSGTSVLSLEVDLEAASGEFQMTGEYVDSASTFRPELMVKAQQDAFKLKDQALLDKLTKVLGGKTALYNFVRSPDETVYQLIPSGVADISLKVQDTGAVTLSGSVPYGGKAKKISATGTVFVEDGALLVTLVMPADKEYAFAFSYELGEHSAGLNLHETDCSSCKPD